MFVCEVEKHIVLRSQHKVYIHIKTHDCLVCDVQIQSD